MNSKDRPQEAELSVKLRVNGENDRKAEEEAQPTLLPTITRKIKVQKISRQENKAVAAGKRFEALKVSEDGFLQSLIIAWYGSSTVPTVNIHLDLGKSGSFNVDFEEYVDAGLVLAHSAQDFWISKKDDTGKKYAIVITPSIPIEFNGLRIILTNKNATDLTISLAQLKYYNEN